MKHYFVTGIGTDVGKTIVSAILTEALEADYWKPIQAGDLEHCDTKKVQRLVSNKQSVFHENSYALTTPMSPHGAADIDSVSIALKNIKRPQTKNKLVIEGAGGLLVPLNNKQTVADLIKKNDEVIVVSRHYLGSINHTLLSIKYLQSKGFKPKLVFNGNEHLSTETIIKKITQVEVIGRIDDEPYFDKNVIKEYTKLFKESL